MGCILKEMVNILSETACRFGELRKIIIWRAAAGRQSPAVSNDLDMHGMAAEINCAILRAHHDLPISAKASPFTNFH